MANMATSGMSSKEKEPRIKTNWRRTTNEPSSAWRRLVAKLFVSRKEKPADSHPEKGTNTAQDAGDGGQELSQ